MSELAPYPSWRYNSQTGQGIIVTDAAQDAVLGTDWSSAPATSTAKASTTAEPTQVEVGPQPIPAGMSVVVARDCRIRWVRITNPTLSALTISVNDRQAQPMAIVPTMIVKPGGQLTYRSELGDKAPGGVTWTASDAGLEGYLIATQ